jgi:predicted DNA-binding ribbon-helix-helix protein
MLSGTRNVEYVAHSSLDGRSTTFELTEAWWLTLDQMNMYALTNMAGLVIGIPRRHVDQRAW